MSLSPRGSIIVGTGLKMRTVSAGDIENLIGFWRSIDGVGLGKGDDRESLERFIRRNPTTCFLLTEEERVVGSVLGGFDGRQGTSTTWPYARRSADRGGPGVDGWYAESWRSSVPTRFTCLY